jgi:hypothetical protein
MSVTAIRQDTARQTRRQTRSVFKRCTDADVYAVVALAWFHLHQPSEHLANPMKVYAVCPDFARDVWGRPDVDPHEVIAVCARIVSVEKWQLTEGQQTAGCARLTEALDPLNAWWQPLGGADGLGVHYWRLAVGIIELRSVGPVDQPPALQFGRFTERERRREGLSTSRARTARHLRSSRR